MPQFTGDYAPCLDLLLNRHRAESSFSQGLARLARPRCSLKLPPSLAMPQSTPREMNQTRRFPDFGSVVGPTPKHALTAGQWFSCWMRFTTWMIGQSTSKVIGTTCIDRLFQS